MELTTSPLGTHPKAPTETVDAPDSMPICGMNPYLQITGWSRYSVLITI